VTNPTNPASRNVDHYRPAIVALIIVSLTPVALEVRRARARGR
jgi:hypothetical protein